MMKDKNIIYISLSRALIILGQLVYIKLYTKYLNNYELGIYAFLSTVSYSLTALIFVPVDYYQQSRIYKFIENNISLKSFFRFNSLLILYIILFSMIVSIPFLLLDRRKVLYISVCIGLSIILYLTTTLKGVINNLEYRNIVSNLLVVETISKILFFYIAVQFMPTNALTLFVSGIGSGVLTLFLLIRYSIKLNIFHNGRIERINFKEVIGFTYPISVCAVLNWLQLQGYRMILVPLGLVEIVGIYATVSNVGIAGMNAYSTVFGQMFVPNIYKTHGEYTKNYIRNAFLSVCFILILSYFISDIILKIVTKAEFVKYSNLILYGILTEAGNFILGALAIHLAIKNKTINGIMASVVGMLSMMCVFVFLYFTNHFNIFTIGLPMILSQIITTLYLYYISIHGNHNA